MNDYVVITYNGELTIGNLGRFDRLSAEFTKTKQGALAEAQRLHSRHQVWE